MSGRGKAQKSLDLIDAAREILEEIHPATVRAVCYRLFVAGLIPSMAVANTAKVSKLLVWGREEGIIPWEHIVDETRAPERIPQWNNPEELINAAVRQYRKDYWSTQPRWLEVWSEKGTVRGTLAPVLDQYGVTFRVMHGYGSATALHSIAREIERREKLLYVLYVGDWDPSGLHMSECDLPSRLRRYDGFAVIDRIALSYEDIGLGVNKRGRIIETTLPSFGLETKSRDPRHAWFLECYGSRCWELDALSPVVLRERVEAEIRKHLDMKAWNRAIEVETAETESLGNVLGAWKSILRPVEKYSPGGDA